MLGGYIRRASHFGRMGAGQDVTRALVQKRARLLGISVGHRESFEAINRALALHHIRPVIDRSFALHVRDYLASELTSMFAAGDFIHERVSDWRLKVGATMDRAHAHAAANASRRFAACSTRT